MGGLKDRYIRFDWAIKRLLRQKANFDVLEGFLTVFIGEEVKIVEILESEGNQQTQDDKFNRVDIKARNSKGEIILVEVQNTSELYYLERILYGVAKAITEHIHLGDTYKEVKKVYSISILYFDIGKGADYLYVGQNKFIGVHTNDQLVITAKEKGAFVQKSPAEIFPEYILVRVNEFDKVAVTPLEEWVAYLKSGVIKENTTAPGLQEARKKLQYYSMTDAERYAYDEHLNAVMIQNDVLGNAREEGLAEGRAEGRAEGLTQGRAEGRAEAKKDIVKVMLAEGLSVEQAAKYSGLTVEEVESIK
ncbi:Rpn family recombination-promoting nuclease/putative transposase [Leyella stercorea]|uniref:Rpn family recombination-promoting nuclease/putative transposase n=1 Tax=Leyella stercorea TaxID=363265 RepID=UPI001A4FDE63|nr:Rpn family recombination-promoting nuclease/putative transposase [Leyella stercorea]MBL6518002.1 Rpn family recombination-promoting nuclease/putative transposase [Leyella stercorea]